MSPAPSVIRNFFRLPKVVTPWKVPLRNFSALWYNTFSIKNRDGPSWALTFCYPKHSETQNGSCTNIFDSEKEQFRRKIVFLAPSFIHILFQYRNFSETQKGISTKVFATVRLKVFDIKMWHNRLTQKKNFDTWISWHKKGFPYEILWQWDKNIWRKIMIVPPHILVFKFSDTWNFLHVKSVPLRSFSVL